MEKYSAIPLGFPPFSINSEKDKTDYLERKTKKTPDFYFSFFEINNLSVVSSRSDDSYKFNKI